MNDESLGAIDSNLNVGYILSIALIRLAALLSQTTGQPREAEHDAMIDMPKYCDETGSPSVHHDVTLYV